MQPGSCIQRPIWGDGKLAAWLGAVVLAMPSRSHLQHHPSFDVIDSQEALAGTAQGIASSLADSNPRLDTLLDKSVPPGWFQHPGSLKHTQSITCHLPASWAMCLLLEMGIDAANRRTHDYLLIVQVKELNAH